jgi:hypothetical protein
VELHVKNRINVSDGNVATYEKFHMMSNMLVSYGAFLPASDGGGDSEPPFDPEGDMGDMGDPGDAGDAS